MRHRRILLFLLLTWPYIIHAQPGKDCNTPVRIACTEYRIDQLFPGFNRQQAQGTCLEVIANNTNVFFSYLSWTAAENENLTFTITPNGSNDDVDWGLYELAPGQDCASVNASSLVRCSSAGGCSEVKTGMQNNEQDVSEGPGCSEGQNGFVKNHTMRAGYKYVLLVLNVSSSLGFQIKFPPSKTFLNADFSAIQNFPVKTASPYTVDFINKTTGADEYIWDFGDGTTSNQTNPTHTFTYTAQNDKPPRPQYFYVTLKAEKDNSDCAAVIKKGPIVLLPPSGIFVPNSFTPNGDGVNDDLAVTVPDLSAYRIQIFNRYGTKLFESRNIFDNWKGTYRNEPVPVGVYFYVIDGVNLEGEKIQKTGSVTALR